MTLEPLSARPPASGAHGKFLSTVYTADVGSGRAGYFSFRSGVASAGSDLGPKLGDRPRTAPRSGVALSDRESA